MVYHDFLTRLSALVRKEFRQMWRDKSNMAIGLILPMILILIFGYGISLDVKNAPIAVVMNDTSPTARDAVAALYGSPYLSPTMVFDMNAGEQLMSAQKVAGIARVPASFSHDLADGHGQMQLILNGVDGNSAGAISGYVNGALGQWAQQYAQQKYAISMGQVEVVSRLWFNAANTSTWYLVPGLIALIMTIVGAFLTSLIVAREWERGTFEALFVTPVRVHELLLAKLVPYFSIGMVGLVLCMVAAKWLFAVPMYGSLWVLLLASVLYLFTALGMGLLISSLTKNQFLASQVALVASFLPALMLSGFIFDLNNAPRAIQVIGQIVPATHYMSLIKSLYLAGNIASVILKECLILAAYAVLFLVLSRRVTRKRLDG